MISKAQIKFIKALHAKKNRQELQLFIAEGIKIVDELVQSDQYTIHSIYHLPSYTSKSTSKLYESYEINEKDLQQITTLNSPNAVLAIVRSRSAAALPIEKGQLYLALDGIQDPGNLGTIMRTADWFGITTIFCSTTCVEYTNPKVIMSSMGSFTRVKIIYCDLQQLISSNDFREILGASLQGNDLFTLNLPSDGLLVIGSESHGISAEIENLLTQKIRIPSFGSVESLNASIANAIILSEWKRQYYG